MANELKYFVPDTVFDGYVRDVDSGQLNIPDRIYAQYRNKPKAVQWYQITRRLANQLGNAAVAVRIMYDIDTAVGEQLDILGRIVVVSRSFLGHQPLEVFQFAEPDGAEFGDDAAVFSATNVDVDQQMSDDLYRLVIKSKIIKNNSDASIESLLYGMNFLLPNAQILRVTDNEDMSFSVELYGNISNLERWALLNSTLVPKPQGVKFNGFLEGYDYVQFGDDDTQFGDESAEFTGFTGV